MSKWRFSQSWKIVTNFKKIIIPCIFLLFGLLLYSYPMLLDTNRMPGSLSDTRLINYILEHEYLWLTHAPLHNEFWSAPYFYPLKNSAANSDLLIGALIFYAPLRIIIDNPQAVIQFLYIIANILNFSIFYIFVRKIFKFNIFYTSLAAFFFAFSLSRFTHVERMQLFFQSYMILPVFFLCSIKQTNSKRKNLMYFSLSSISYVLLAYTTFYYAWLLALGVSVAALISLCFKNTRNIFISYLKNFNLYFIIPLIPSLLLLGFLGYKYLSSGNSYASIYHVYFPDILMSGSLLDFLIFKLGIIDQPERIIGVGIFTTLFVLIGLFKTKYKKQIAIFITIFFIIFAIPSVFKFLYENIKFFSAIRATGRFVLLLIPIYSILLVSFFKSIKFKPLLIILITIFILEQIPATGKFNWTKTQHNERLEKIQISDKCEIASLDYRNAKNEFEAIILNVDMMWWANNHQKYTTNGFGLSLGLVDISQPKECIYIAK